jgi:hypothetical protein
MRSAVHQGPQSAASQAFRPDLSVRSLACLFTATAHQVCATRHDIRHDSRCFNCRTVSTSACLRSLSTFVSRVERRSVPGAKLCTNPGWATEAQTAVPGISDSGLSCLVHRRHRLQLAQRSTILNPTAAVPAYTSVVRRFRGAVQLKYDKLPKGRERVRTRIPSYDQQLQGTTGNFFRHAQHGRAQNLRILRHFPA